MKKFPSHSDPSSNPAPAGALRTPTGKATVTVIEEVAPYHAPEGEAPEEGEGSKPPPRARDVRRRSATASPIKRYATRSLFVLAGTLVAVLAAEWIVRQVNPRQGLELPLFRKTQTSTPEVYELDDQLAFKPIFATHIFDELGIVKADHDYVLDDARDRKRILFIGDSVTYRGLVIKAIRDAFGDEGYEFWNGGVTAYNTTQEVDYYERFTRASDPDHVVLVFHLNDFLRTPISFTSSSGRMRVIMPYKDLTEVNPWLFAHSHIYRFYVDSTRTPDAEEAMFDVRQALERLIAITQADETQLTILVHPDLTPLQDWNRHVLYRYEWIMQTLAELDVPHITLLPSLQRALADGVNTRETPGDSEHPSAAVSRYFAEDLLRSGLLAGD